MFEFGNEARRSERGRVVLSTVHGAKGREFKHVAILDGGDWRQASDEERRLYYVGMTRAKENLILCEAVSPNPFSPGLEGSHICRTPLPAQIPRRKELDWRYLSLGLAEVDVGFAGRHKAAGAVHRALASLRVGDPLRILNNKNGLELTDEHGQVVGRLARKISLRADKVIRASVESLVWRTRSQTTDPTYQDSIKADDWWVVLPLIVLDA